MGIVSDALRHRITDQINAHGIVVWFDPEGRYTTFIAQVDLPETTVVPYAGSYFALRQRIDHLLDDDVPPRLLVYLPLSLADTQHALAELTSLGVVMSPEALADASTDLRSLAGEALQGRLGREVIAQLLAQIKHPVETGLSLEELDREIDRYAPPHVGLLTTVYGSNDPVDILLRFLSDPARDADLRDRTIWPEMIAFCSAQIGLVLVEPTIPKGRDRLAQWILQTDLLATLHDPPPQLQTIDAAAADAVRATCAAIAARWRQSYPESYNAQAYRVERLLQLDRAAFTRAQAQDCHTFPAIDAALQTTLEGSIADQPADIALVAARQRGYWVQQARNGEERLGLIAERWTILLLAGQLCQVARQVEDAANQSGRAPAAFVGGYTAATDPWCHLEDRQRHLESAVQKARLSAVQSTTKTLITTARQRYQRAADHLARAFTQSLHAANFQIPGVLRQREIFAAQVQPALQRGRVAYLLIDALRFEMARQIVARLGEGFTATLDPAIATPPTITAIGMAALMPGADQPVELVEKRGALGLKIGATNLFDRKARLAWLKAQHLTNASGSPAKIQDIWLNDLRADRHTTPTWAKADLLIVTAQDIDESGETDHAAFRPVMDDTMREVEGACLVLRQMGFTTILITADHGHLYGTSLGDDMAIDPPGGETVDLHRRAWVGRGGAESADVLRVPLERFAIGGGYDLAVPWGLGIFRAQGGNRAYMHGGLALPELVIPVARIDVTAPTATATNDWEWALELSRTTITSRILAVRVVGTSNALMASPATLILELRAGNTIIGHRLDEDSQSSGASFTISRSPEDPYSIAERSIIHVVAERKPEEAITLRLLDAATRRELANVPLTWAITI